MKTILHTEQLNVGYDKKVVIRDVDIRALKGQTVCLIGPNGAGKSTILRTLTGLLAPVDGCVYIGREEVHKIRPAEKARKLAVVLTDRLNLNMTTAREVVAMGRTPYTGFLGKLSQEDKEIVEQCLKTVDAWELRDRDFTSLSDGEKQKVLIARALAQKPKLIVLDEPTSHLDIRHKVEVVRILNKLALETGLTVILALHDIDIAVKFCQIVLMVKDGRIVAKGRPEEIIDRDTVGRLYDIRGAFYDSILGNLEICNDADPEIYVAAGAGSGIPVYRALTRMGFGIATGMLTENDVDYLVASAMHLETVAGSSFEPFDGKTVEKAGEWMERCRLLIDAGFPIGQENRKNIEMLLLEADRGKTVFCLRTEEECRRLYGERPTVRALTTIHTLFEELEKGEGFYADL